MKSLVGFVLITIVALIISLLVYLGTFKDVAVSVGEDGPIRVVQKAHVGPYHKIVPTIEVVEKWATANGEACQTSFGEYLEDPEVIDEDRLHANGGCVVVKDWTGQALPEGLTYREIPRRQYVMAEFDGAPSIAPQKVYPKMNKLVAEKGLKSDGGMLELYERVGARDLKSRYRLPVAPMAP